MSGCEDCKNRGNCESDPLVCEAYEFDDRPTKSRWVAEIVNSRGTWEKVLVREDETQNRIDVTIWTKTPLTKAWCRAWSYALITEILKKNQEQDILHGDVSINVEFTEREETDAPRE